MVRNVQSLDCSNSRRHVSKTHGSHNGRWYTWPHVSDRLDRPDPLPEPTTVPPSRRTGSCKVRHPRTSSREGRASGMGRWRWDDSGLRLYLVRADCAHDGRTIEVKVSARTEAEAASIGRDLLAIESGSSVLKLRTLDVTGDTTPPPASSVKINPWLSD